MLNIPQGFAAQLGPGYLADMDRFDVIVRTAGLPPRLITEQNPGLASRITTALNEFLAVSPTKHIIGVTGTKGKGTTSTLITKMLEAAGKHVFLGGNIGRSPLEFVDELQEDDWVVLETSSFQLIDATHSPHIAVCLMVVPEHLNWHADMAEYIAAKSQLFAHQTSDDVAIYFAENDNSKDIAKVGDGQKLPYFTPPGAYVDGDRIVIDDTEVCKLSDIKLLGEHNWQNVCAAVTAVWQAGVHDVDALRSAISTFTGLEHRIEFVREVNHVSFYNDSFATGLHATEAAVEAIPGQKVLIVGGFDRKLPLEHFVKFVAERNDIATILLIGQAADRLAELFQSAGVQNYELGGNLKTMEQIVMRAQELAPENSAVVFSPGFASFDMFKNFEERGLQFKSEVEKL